MRYHELFEDRQFSSAFRTWFHGSKVVDDKGEPLLVYHGTPRGFDEFDHKTIGTGNDAYGAGIYFTVNPTIASGYSDNNKPDENPNVRPCYLAIKKPLIVSDKGEAGKDLPPAITKKLILMAPDYRETLTNFGDVDYEGEARVLAEAVRAYNGQDYLRGLNMIANDFYHSDTAMFLRNCMKVTPYDGVIVPYHDFYVVWSSDQVMSYFDQRTMT